MTAGDYFALKGGNHPWGDYGDLLWHGLVEGSETPSEQPIIRVSRTGPFVPPITQPFSEIIIDDNLRRQLKDSGLTGFEFAPVRYEKLVRIEWHTWDPNSDEPKFYPDSGEPEDYIQSGDHDASLEHEMPTLWALIVPSTCGLQVEGSGTFRLSVHPKTDIAREGYLRWVSCRMKNLIEASVGSWVRFTNVRPL